MFYQLIGTVMYNDWPNAHGLLMHGGHSGHSFLNVFITFTDVSRLVEYSSFLTGLDQDFYLKGRLN